MDPECSSVLLDYSGHIDGRDGGMDRARDTRDRQQLRQCRHLARHNIGYLVPHWSDPAAWPPSSPLIGPPGVT